MALRLISLEGNIGSGKTTLFRLLRSNLNNCNFISQPVEAWQKSNILKFYYEDPYRWAFTFQTYALFSRLKGLRAVLDAQIPSEEPPRLYISERSVQADKQIFGKLLRQQKMMNETEYNLYLQNFDTFAQQFKSPIVQKFVYLRCSPETAFSRIKKRSRMQEADKISLDYLKKIHQKHEDWLSDKNALVIDANREFQQDECALSDIIKQIKGLA